MHAIAIDELAPRLLTRAELDIADGRRIVILGRRRVELDNGPAGHRRAERPQHHDKDGGMARGRQPAA